MDGLPFHFVGSLPPSDHPDLLAVPKAAYRPVDEERFPGLSAFEADKGRLRHRAAHRRHPLRGPARQAVRRLRPDAGQGAPPAIRGPGSPRPGQDPQGQRQESKPRSADILRPRWVSRVVSASLSGEEPCRAAPALPHRRKRPGPAWKKRSSASGYCSPTKAQSWPRRPKSSADYRSQEAAEGDFRQMKDPKVVSFSPMFHWTDQKIRVHVFYCVLALMVARLMAREAARAGLR